MLGMPNIKFKLPSRNWLIFLSITGSFTAAVFYDRYHKKKAQRRWCSVVSHLAQEPLTPKELPRKITIFLSAPPGDSLRAAREHFHEYVKPVLVAGAMDWDVIEGRREGDVRAGLAEKIRSIRRRQGELTKARVEEAEKEEEDLLGVLRKNAGIQDWPGAQGDLVLGRHTWKEYIRGLHEGWLGPLDRPPDPTKFTPSSTSSSSFATTNGPSSDTSTHESPLSDSFVPEETSNATTLSSDASPTTEVSPPALDSENEKKKEENEKSKIPVQAPPYIVPSAYLSASLSPSTPETLPPSTTIPHPDILGFLNTPIRIYRFLNRRHLADQTGREVAALVLATHSRPYNANTEFASSNDPDSSPSLDSQLDGAVVAATKQSWEQEEALQHEEKDWHKSAWKGDEEAEGRRVLREPMVLDSRVAGRMRRFDIAAEVEEMAKADEGMDTNQKGLWKKTKDMLGWGEDERIRGWEHGLVGAADE